MTEEQQFTAEAIEFLQLVSNGCIMVQRFLDRDGFTTRFAVINLPGLSQREWAGLGRFVYSAGKNGYIELVFSGDWFATINAGGELKITGKGREVLKGYWPVFAHQPVSGPGSWKLNETVKMQLGWLCEGNIVHCEHGQRLQISKISTVTGEDAVLWYENSTHTDRFPGAESWAVTERASLLPGQERHVR